MRIAVRFSGRRVPFAALSLLMGLTVVPVSAQAAADTRPLVLVATLDNDIINPIRRARVFATPFEAVRTPVFA